MKNALKFLLALAVMLLVMLAVRAFAFTIYRVDTTELKPQFQKGDKVMVNRLRRSFTKGNFIAFGNDNVTVGQVVAVPGDTVTIRNQQYLLPLCCPYCGNKGHRYYLVTVGSQQTLVHKNDIVGAVYRIK